MVNHLLIPAEVPVERFWYTSFDSWAPTDPARQGYSRNGAPKPMAVLGTWNVIITRRDGSEYAVTILRGHAPQRGEVIDVKTAGQALQARVDTVIHFLPSATGPGIWRVSATEILVADTGSSDAESRMARGLLVAAWRRHLLGTVSHVCMDHAA